MICVYACIYRTCFPSSLLLPQVPVCSVWPRVSVEWSTVEWLNSSGSVFWSSLTYVQRFSFWNSSSICPLIPPAAGWERELGIEWACCAYCEVEIRGGYCWLLLQKTVALTHDRLKPFQCYIPPAKNIILWMLATSLKRQGGSLYCQGSLVRSKLFLFCLQSFTSLAMNLPTSPSLESSKN